MIALNADQSRAVDKLEKLRVGALFMEPGTGKTRVALNLVNSSQTDFALFICPFQTKQNLKAEIEKWGINVSYRIEGVESLSNSDRLYLELTEQLESFEKPFMVVDESLKIKNRTAKRTQRVLKMGNLSYYRLVLNGTPLSKNVLDLWSQMEFLSHKILSMSYAEFMNRFVEYEVIRDEDRSRLLIKDYANIDYLYSLIQPYIVDADLHLNIKSKHIDAEYTLDMEDWENYQQIKTDYMEKLLDLDYDPNIFMAMLTELQQAYCTSSMKLRIVKKLVNEFGKDKTIVFCKYLKSRDKLQADDPSIRVLTYGKGSLGLNLQEYKHVIFFDKTFDYAQLLQASRRVYRMGQDSDVTFHYLTGRIGLEKMIDKNITRKTGLLNSFKQAVAKGEERKLLDEL